MVTSPKLSTRLLLKLRPAIRWVMKLRSSPKAISGGFALGTFIAFTPTLGVQVILAIFFATLLNVNRPASIVPVWVTNPVTMAPIYTFNYFIGQMILGGPPVSEVSDFFIHIAKTTSHLNFWEMKSLGHLILDLGSDLIIPLCFGSLIVGTTLGIITYVIMLPIVTSIFKRKRQKKILN
ncbi:MAG: DUF2062 domain-containing protein [Desulfotalea sp.]